MLWEPQETRLVTMWDTPDLQPDPEWETPRTLAVVGALGLLLWALLSVTP